MRMLDNNCLVLSQLARRIYYAVGVLPPTCVVFGTPACLLESAAVFARPPPTRIPVTLDRVIGRKGAEWRGSGQCGLRTDWLPAPR